MENEKSLLVITSIVNKNNASEIPEYLEKIGKVFAEHGGERLARYKTSESLLGDESPEVMGVMQFPSTEAIKEMMNSESFNALSDLRNRVFSKLNLMICQSM